MARGRYRMTRAPAFKFNQYSICIFGGFNGQIIQVQQTAQSILQRAPISSRLSAEAIHSNHTENNTAQSRHGVRRDIELQRERGSFAVSFSQGNASVVSETNQE